MKKFTLLMMMICLIQVAIAQVSHTVVFQPNGNGIDNGIAVLDSTCTGHPFLHINDTVFSNAQELGLIAWTNSGCEVVSRAIIKFSGISDTSKIPGGWKANITSAHLVLYDETSSLTGNFGNSFYPGSPYPDTNQGYIYNLASGFNANTLTWRNQPGIKHFDSVLIPYTTERFGDDSVVMDVTTLVLDLYLHGNTGFMIKLKNETPYGERLFATSRHPDATRHPKLIVSYKTTGLSAINGPNTFMELYPNPAHNTLLINIRGELKGTLSVMNTMGQIISNREVKSNKENIDISTFPAGVYFVRIANEYGMVTEKFMKE